MADFDYSYNLSSYSTLAGWDACAHPSLEQPQPESIGLMSPEIFISDRAMALEVSTAMRVPGGVPFNHPEHEPGEPSASTSCENVVDPHQSNSGPARTWKFLTRRFEPYEIARARTTEQCNTEAGRSTSDVGLPTLPPTAGLVFETSADAGKISTITEGDKGKGFKRTRKPNGTGKARNFRKREQRDFRELRSLVYRWRNLDQFPTQNQALKEALEYVRTVRMAVYERPRLSQTSRESKSPSEGSMRAKTEREVRDAERVLFGELSQYYPLEMDDGEGDDVWDTENGERDDEYELVWNRPSLLKEVLEDLKVRCPPPELSTNSAH